MVFLVNLSQYSYPANHIPQGGISQHELMPQMYSLKKIRHKSYLCKKNPQHISVSGISIKGEGFSYSFPSSSF